MGYRSGEYGHLFELVAYSGNASQPLNRCGRFANRPYKEGAPPLFEGVNFSCAHPTRLEGTARPIVPND